MLRPGESREVKFVIKNNDLAFYGKNLTFNSEPGAFDVFVGGNSRDVKEARFTLN